jgi:hypothetical protein
VLIGWVGLGLLESTGLAVTTADERLLVFLFRGFLSGVYLGFSV